jgi:hypothetical protein
MNIRGMLRFVKPFTDESRASQKSSDLRFRHPDVYNAITLTETTFVKPWEGDIAQANSSIGKACL